MDVYDLCLAWNWEYDNAFSAILNSACKERGLTLLQLTPGDLPEMREALANGRVGFHAMLDRASEVDAGFAVIVDWALRHGVSFINHPHLAARSWDKAWLHSLLHEASIPTPGTLVIPSLIEATTLAAIDLRALGTPFVVKPAHGSGGEGVLLHGQGWEDIDQARRRSPRDQILAQATVHPAHFDGRPAWFRVLVCAGQVYPCWWHTQTHIYAPLDLEEELSLGLTPLRALSAAIASLCGLDTFSSEIALDETGVFVVVDYVNDQIDLRPQSGAEDGVPDPIVEDIAARLADMALERRPEQAILAPVVFQHNLLRRIPVI